MEAGGITRGEKAGAQTPGLLDVRNLRVGYRVFEGLLSVLNGVSLAVKRGEHVGLIGEAGCGKTTLLKSIAGILPVPPAQIQGGTIDFDGCEILSRRREGIRLLRRGASMIFQDPAAALNPTLTVRTQMADILKSQERRLSRQQRNVVLLDALKRVSMPSPDRVLDSYAVQLSGGMKQRVCIAMALLKKIDLLLADEPTTSLDVTVEEQILELLSDLVEQNQQSMILVSHALGTVRKITDRLYIMYAGDIVESGATTAIFHDPRHPYTRGLFEATPKLTGRGISDGIAGELPSYLDPPVGCRFAPRCPNRMGECLRAKPPVTGLEADRKVACFLYGGADGGTHD